jgi:hypothetical protein
MNHPQMLFRVHAVQRMFERKIPIKRISQTLQSGESIEDYSAEMPEPSRLILGVQGSQPLHVVISEIRASREVIIITAYVPHPDKWNRDLKRRRS